MMDQEEDGLGNPAKLVLDTQSTIPISHFSNKDAKRTSHFLGLPGSLQFPAISITR